MRIWKRCRRCRRPLRAKSPLIATTRRCSGGSEETTRAFTGPDDWSKCWWEVPFEAVANALCDSYREIVDADTWKRCAARNRSMNYESPGGKWNRNRP